MAASREELDAEPGGVGADPAPFTAVRIHSRMTIRPRQALEKCTDESSHAHACVVVQLSCFSSPDLIRRVLRREAVKLGVQDMWPEPADKEAVAEDASTTAEADDLATELKQLSNVRALPTLLDLNVGIQVSKPRS